MTDFVCKHGHWPDKCYKCKELASLRRIAEAMRGFAKEKCEADVFNDIQPSHREWCHVCIARAALEKEGML